jgi:ferredoxin
MIVITPNKCDFCGACVAVCPPDCIELKEADITIEHEICIDCDLCANICPIEVLEPIYDEK